MQYNIIQNFAKSLILENSRVSKRTKLQAQTLRTKNKYMYLKKQHLNKKLLALHLQNTNEWGQVHGTKYN